MSITFASRSSKVFWNAWCATLWKIHDIPLMDRYGFTQEDEIFTIDIDENYADTLPTVCRATAMAMQYGDSWHIDWREVLDMQYDEFYHAMMVSKALNYKKPWWTGDTGYQAYVIEKSGHRKLNKPRKRAR